MPDEPLPPYIFEVVALDGEVVGTTGFEVGDPPMGVASGRFTPTPAYASIRSLVLAAAASGADGPRLRVRTRAGEYLEPCSHVHITDFSDELGDDGLEVTILGLEPYSKFFAHHCEVYESQWVVESTSRLLKKACPGDRLGRPRMI